MSLTHYIVVRRDLPFGQILAQVAHAAGESFYLLGRHSSVKEQLTFSQQVGGSSPSGGSTINPEETVVVVLGARNEGRLRRLQRILLEGGTAHTTIREVDGEYAGQYMAIGLVPGEKVELQTYVNDFHMFTQLQP
jgi:hypothetical protein